MPSEYGLYEIHNPGDSAIVDIILVHGLHGDQKTTWICGSGNGSVFWPKDLLSTDIPNARIFTFGYDAKIVHFWSRPSENSIDTYSVDLWDQLVNKRSETDTSKRPVILVAHSLGGLVCANALVDAASSSADDQKLADCVYGIAFLGTPHEGSDKVKWAEIAQRFLKLIGKDFNSDLSKDLNEKSEKVAKLGTQFPLLLNSRAEKPETRIEVVCFYEGKTITRGGVNIGLIVKKSSACISGYKGTLLDADHENICKFKDKDDINYKRVLGLLMRWTKELANNVTGDEKATYTYHNTFSGGNNHGIQIGHNAGSLSGFNFGKG